MSPAGDADLLIAARSALLEALAALTAPREAPVLIGAQAIYLPTDAETIRSTGMPAPQHHATHCHYGLEAVVVAHA